MKTSHEMAQSVLRKRDRILRRRRILTASIGTAAGITAVAAALAVTFNLNRPRGVDLIESGSVVQIDTLPNSPLSLIGVSYEEGNYRVDTDSWEVLTDCDIFREHFFGTWDSDSSILGSSEFTIDDTENSSLFAQESPLWLRDFYRVSGDVYAFIANGNAVSWLFWLDGSAPDTMYFEEMNGGILYDHLNSGTTVLTKMDEPIKQPENAFLSIFRLREMAQEHGIDMETLLNIEYDIGKDYMLYHDKYQNYPVYLVSESEDEIVLRTKVGNPMTKEEISVEYTLSRENGAWKRTSLAIAKPEGYTDFASADIPDITPEDRGLQAMGTRNVLLDTKQAGAFSVLLVGDYVTTDNAGHSGMISCFDFGVQIYDGNTVSDLAGAHSGAGAGDYWIYTDRFSDYMDVFQFGDNYIIALRYYDTDGARYTIFIAIKDGTFYPELIGDYSAVTGVQLDVTTWLSKNYSVDVDSCTITDNDSGISYVFDFDAISDTFTRPHYTAVKSAGNEAVSDRLAEMWLNKWTEITASMDLLLPKVSVFGFELSDGSRLVAFVYPNYKSYGAVFYRISGSDITELGNETCGSDFELLENPSGQYLHTTIRFAGGVMNADSIYVDDSYYLITESSLDPVLRVGKELYNEEAVYWSVYENEESVSVTAEEYENLINSALPECAAVSAVSLDKDGDYKIDDFCAFEDDTDGLKAAILSAL